jgi:hypothetical protein
MEPRGRWPGKNLGTTDLNPSHESNSNGDMTNENYKFYKLDRF